MSSGLKKQNKKKTFNIGLYSDIYRSILFQNWLFFFSNLMFTQGHRVMGKLEIVQLFCCIVAWSNSNVHDG